VGGTRRHQSAQRLRARHDRRDGLARFTTAPRQRSRREKRRIAAVSGNQIQIAIEPARSSAAAVACIASLAAGKETRARGDDMSGQREMHMWNCPSAIPGATTNVVELDDGVGLTITARDEAVRQEIWRRAQNQGESAWKLERGAIEHTRRRFARQRREADGPRRSSGADRAAQAHHQEPPGVAAQAPHATRVRASARPSRNGSIAGRRAVPIAARG